MELIRRFSDRAYAAAVDSWSWMPGVRHQQVRFATAFGDLMLESGAGFSFLDMVSGTLELRWSTAAELQAAVNDPKVQAELLMPDLVAAADGAGLVPGPNKILGFRVPAVLGGAMTVENLELVDFSVSAHIAAQIHQQVKGLPVGAPIKQISIDQDGP